MYMYVLTQYNQWKRIPTIYRVCTCMYSPNTTNGKEFLLYIGYVHVCTHPIQPMEKNSYYI